MQKPQVVRKLAAIVAADVAGYSRLMGADEEGTLAQPRATAAPWSIRRSGSTAAPSSKPPATACCWSSRAPSTRCAARWRSSAAWPSATPVVPPEKTASARRKPPASLQAYDYYLLGMQARLHLTEQEERKAVDLFQKAVDLDPQYAAGHMGLGSSMPISLGGAGEAVLRSGSTNPRRNC